MLLRQLLLVDVWCSILGVRLWRVLLLLWLLWRLLQKHACLDLMILLLLLLYMLLLAVRNKLRRKALLQVVLLLVVLLLLLLRLLLWLLLLLVLHAQPRCLQGELPTRIGCLLVRAVRLWLHDNDHVLFLLVLLVGGRRWRWKAGSIHPAAVVVVVGPVCLQGRRVQAAAYRCSLWGSPADPAKVADWHPRWWCCLGYASSCGGRAAAVILG